MSPIEALQSALEALSSAHGPAALRDAFRSVQRRIRTARQADGEAKTLGLIIMEAVVYRENLKEKGASQRDLDAGLEAVVRDSWPKPKDRTQPWRYICEDCGDTGLQMFMCVPGNRCNGISTRVDSPGDRPGKHNRLCVGSATYEHEYWIPCTCAKGDTFRPRQQNADDAFVTAAKNKPKPMTRFGR